MEKVVHCDGLMHSDDGMSITNISLKKGVMSGTISASSSTDYPNQTFNQFYLIIM